MRWTSVSEEDMGDEVKWSCRIRVTYPKWLEQKTKEEEKKKYGIKQVV